MPLPQQCQLSDTRHTGRGHPPPKVLSEGPPIHLCFPQDLSLKINSSLTPAEELKGEGRVLRMKTTDNVGTRHFWFFSAWPRVERNQLTQDLWLGTWRDKSIIFAVFQPCRKEKPRMGRCS